MVFVVLWSFENLSFGTVLFSWMCGCALFSCYVCFLHFSCCAFSFPCLSNFVSPSSQCVSNASPPDRLEPNRKFSCMAQFRFLFPYVPFSFSFLSFSFYKPPFFAGRHSSSTKTWHVVASKNVAFLFCFFSVTAFWQRRWVRSCCLRAVNVSFNGTAFHFWFTVRFVLFVVNSFSLPFGWRFVPTSRHVSFMAPFHVWTAISPPCFCHYSGDLQASRFCHLHCLAPKTAIMHFLCCPYVSFAMLYFSPFSLLSLIRPASTFLFLQLVSLLQLSDCVCLCHAWHIADLRTHICSMRLCICFALRFLFSVSVIWKCCSSDKQASDDDTIAVLILPMMSFHEALWRSDAHLFCLFVLDTSFVYCIFVFPLTPVFFEGRILRTL